MKILLISNIPLSHINSNGRTMLNLLNKFNKDEIFNIFIHGDLDDVTLANFYKIDEAKLIKKPLSKNLIYPITKAGSNSLPNVNNNKYPTLKRIIRTTLWKNPNLKKQCFNLVKTINPDVIIIQCGSSSFFINLAVKISTKFNIPLVSYNTEDYIFRTWDFLSLKNHRNIIVKIFQRDLLNSYNKLYKTAKSFVYLNESLEKLFQNKYPNHKSTVIYNSFTFKIANNSSNKSGYLYLGNITLGRAKSLIEVSKLLYKYLKEKLVIYTASTNKKDLKLLQECETIELNDAVSYEKCNELINNCKCLFHVESLDPFYSKNVANGFSTKIADSLSSGKPFVVLLSEKVYLYQYFKKNDCAFAFTNIKDMEDFFIKVSANKDYLYEKRDNQLRTAAENHSIDKNSLKFYNVINEVVKH